jgi:hypothetical protein
MTRTPHATGYVDLYRQVLDHMVVDADDWPVGTVDDLETEGAPGEPLCVTALLIGTGAWSRRLPALVGRTARACFGEGVTRVAWEEISELGEIIRLRSRAPALGLGSIDRRLGMKLAKVPGGETAKS